MATPRLDKFLFIGGLGILAVAGVGAVLAVIGGIRIKLRKARLAREKS